MNKNGQRVTLESRNSVSYSDDKKRSTDASERIPFYLLFLKPLS
ncbi:MAG: hypothetical protein ACR5LA_09585 [Wolbachia sp.]